MPWFASFHQPHAATPSREIAGGLLESICAAFSAVVIRETRSAARSAGRVGRVQVDRGRPGVRAGGLGGLRGQVSR